MLDLFSERKAVTAWDPVDGESHLDTLLRAIVISRLGRAGDQVTLFTLTFDDLQKFSNRKSEPRPSEGLMPTALVAPASRQTSGFHPLLKKQVLIHCVLRSAVYGCVAAAGQAEDYHAMLRLHEQADSHEEKERIAR